MLDFPLMLLVKWPVVDRIHPQNITFATVAENKATGDSNLNDSPGVFQWFSGQAFLFIVSFCF